MSSLSKHELTTLVLIDAQEKLCRAMADFETMAAKKMIQILEAARILGVGTMITEQYPKGLGPTVPAIKNALSPITPVIEKTSFSCWGSEDFRKAVQAIRPRYLVLIGMETHVCVQQTALDALEEGYRVVVAADAVCSRHAEDREMALACMRARGVTITTVEAIVFDWMRDAGHPKFKPISTLFR
ncbi:MAG: hydrolase [Lentisphaeria bacterium]|nr:hydrolase [Lentisphaeria bacterium]